MKLYFKNKFSTVQLGINRFNNICPIRKLSIVIEVYKQSKTKNSEGAKVLKPNNVITDGPYAEVKEIVGGALIVKADSFDEAMKMAAGCPIFNIGGNVEVRNVIPMTM